MKLPSKTLVIKSLEEILTRMRVSFEGVSEEDDGIGITRLNVVSESDSRLLIGPQGEHLQALNAVVKRITEAKEGESLPYIIDVNNYQKRLIDKLRDQTKIISARVKLFRKESPMPAMSAYERMIVHAVAQTIEGVKTRSEGVGSDRYVVLVPTS